MPFKKKTKYTLKTFESTGTTSDVSANIYDSMILSEAYRSLSSKQRDLYTHCKLQLYRVADKNKPDRLDPTQFYFNRYLWKHTYKLYSGGGGGFYKDMEQLIKKGFIRCLSSGKTARVKSIYQFSDKWRLYGTDEFCIYPNELSMRDKDEGTDKET